MDVQAFDFELPESLIAQTPLLNRTASRLLTLNKQTGAIGHQTFEQLIDYLEAGDLLVMNDTRVIPARLFGMKKDTGAKVELLLLKQLGEDRWEALVKPGKRMQMGAVAVFGVNQEEEPLLTAEVVEVGEMGARVLQFSYKGIFNEILDRLGEMPLPPYIKEQLPERERYQTVYAKHEGSAAAPTAGLHFTEAYLEKLQAKGVRLAFVTLHVGLGTFRPVSVDTIEEHQMHAEYYVLSAETAAAINETKANGKRVVAVGTTSARTLETAAGISREQGGAEAGKPLVIQPSQGWTSIFIYPGYTFGVVDALLTNFHLPKSTLLMLISALAGRTHIMQAYEEAVREEYRFFSFGDAMLIY
ncbi:tRNA preQ1(34) S-adenosylmethionine ribosyltransferase-isomerase QueA [Paenibacillus sp. CGMCC 1.16610]|uniref:S-adenosylmethionine:tRNA ribosyltransferase-isomerase n=1 Tax=Paenibacillus anseongense TaxID=2682845 RepID=A0ABW9U8U4_9BACL|nr:MULTISPECIES: tRNA preQ1(34) S-adenosylmethionine ribosyltransferase-isomerase QueA [Paenibacillus]MBA2939274.1 tRNA preQ1(34) S-adenosylmethionine ribosyltransferase-isomerase QueA [Paenibacillus sp. CGMCC 1.16610]MVQ35233.1 tRNA preQ1(34) S-adenosylmethionine ribosyltransferase-isomerase QueA [Paenibacillus anseongense]